MSILLPGRSLSLRSRSRARSLVTRILATGPEPCGAGHTRDTSREAGSGYQELLGQILRDLPDVAVRIGLGDRAHAPRTIRRSTDQCHSVLVHLSAHSIHAL